MVEDHAIVRLHPVHRASSSSELHLQADVLALIRRRLACVLDEEVSVGLVISGCGNISTSWDLCQYHFSMQCFVLCGRHTIECELLVAVVRSGVLEV